MALLMYSDVGLLSQGAPGRQRCGAVHSLLHEGGDQRPVRDTRNAPETGITLAPYCRLLQSRKVATALGMVARPPLLWTPRPVITRSLPLRRC